MEISRKLIQDLLFNNVQDSPIKYCSKTEATNIISNTNISENKTVKKMCRPLFLKNYINIMLDDDFAEVLQEEEEMLLKVSRFSLYKIDGILVNINKYKLIGGSSYIPLPKIINDRNATINIHNHNNECFIYSVLTTYVIISYCDIYMIPLLLAE